MNDIADDMTFMRDGTDLVMDLNFNGSLSQGEITIKDMQLGLSRVEILRLNYIDGSTVDVDLKTIFDQSTSTAQTFTITDEMTNFGYIAAPV